MDTFMKMESDHDEAGAWLKQLEALTGNYTAPAGACNNYKLLYKKLKALQFDIHRHIHLENNVLFPKILELEKSQGQLTATGR